MWEDGEIMNPSIGLVSVVPFCLYRESTNDGLASGEVERYQAAIPSKLCQHAE